jgi:hypothetical protein
LLDLMLKELTKTQWTKNLNHFPKSHLRKM